MLNIRETLDRIKKMRIRANIFTAAQVGSKLMTISVTRQRGILFEPLPMVKTNNSGLIKVLNLIRIF